MDTCSRRVSALGILYSSIRASKRASRRDPGILPRRALESQTGAGKQAGRQAGPAAKASRSPRGALTLTTHYQNGPIFQLPFYGESNRNRGASAIKYNKRLWPTSEEGEGRERGREREMKPKSGSGGHTSSLSCRVSSPLLAPQPRPFDSAARWF